MRKNLVNYSNRGKAFEGEIEGHNHVYRQQNFGFVQKIATPIRTHNGKYWREQSTIDFMGVLQGHPISFDAKETIRDSWNIKSGIEDHQIDCLMDFHMGGGKAFVLLNWAKHFNIWMIPIATLTSLIEDGYKSLKYIHTYKNIIVFNIGFADYIKYLDKL